MQTSDCTAQIAQLIIADIRILLSAQREEASGDAWNGKVAMDVRKILFADFRHNLDFSTADVDVIAGVGCTAYNLAFPASPQGGW